MALTPSECYHHNLAALGGFQPDVAAAVDATPIPAGVTPATGRDGSRTFLILAENGSSAWFGGSSMPTISAPEAFAGFHSDGRSVALSGVCTGLEPLTVAGRMPRHAAVFVLEQSPLNLKLAMQLYDYTDCIAARRLIFVLGDGEELSDGLCKFFQEHPGFELPGQLLTAMRHSSSEIAELQCLLEQAGRKASESHERVVQSQVRVLQARSFGPLPDAPRVVVLSIDPRPISVEHAGRIERALTALGWPFERCVPDAPDKCHVAARLEAVNAVSADLVLMINGTSGSTSRLLPDDLPVACWYLPGSVVQPVNPQELGRYRIMFASSHSFYDALADAGVPADNIEHCAMGADYVTHQPLSPPPEEPGAPRADIVVLGDVPDDRPEACNVNLASHVALWRALQDVTRQQADSYRPDTAEKLLDDAQRRSGTTLKEPKVRAHFVSLLQTRIAPAVLARVAVETLVKRGYAVEKGHSTSPRSETSLFLFPHLSALSVQSALDALAAGGRVVCRRPPEPFERSYPQLADVAPHLHFYGTSRELRQVVRRLTAGPVGPGSAQSLVRDKHTVARRLRTIVETIRRRQLAVTRNITTSVP